MIKRRHRKNLSKKRPTTKRRPALRRVKARRSARKPSRRVPMRKPVHKPPRPKGRTVRRKKRAKKIKARKIKIIRRVVKKRTAMAGRGNGLAVHYFLNPQFQLINELRDFILKSTPREMEEMTQKLNKVGRIKLAIATGIFLSRVNPETVATDLFIVADDLDRRKFRLFLNGVEADMGREVRYVIMEKDEFQYRYGMFDRFIRVLLEGPHEKLINRMGI